MVNVLLKNYAPLQECILFPSTHVGYSSKLANLCIARWKGTFQAFLNHWEPQWLLIDKSTPISNQQSPAVCKSMLCNAIHSHPDFLKVKHLNKLGQAQGSSET